MAMQLKNLDEVIAEFACMTPQLQQAIKLLQLSRIELESEVRKS